MRAWGWGVVAALALCLPPTAYANEAPGGFHGTSWGDGVKETLEHLGSRHQYAGLSNGEKPYFKGTVAGIADAEIVPYFTNGKLVRVLVYFPVEDDRVLVSQFLDIYVKLAEVYGFANDAAVVPNNGEPFWLEGTDNRFINKYQSDVQNGRSNLLFAWSFDNGETLGLSTMRAPRGALIGLHYAASRKLINDL